MKKLLVILAAIAIGLTARYALADYAITQGSGTTVNSFTCSGKVCPGSVIYNSSATELLTTSNPGNVTLQANATGGCTPGHILSGASNNAANIKNAAGTLCSLTWLQTTATLMDIRFYDTSSSPTCSSSTGVVANFVVAANTTSPVGSIYLGAYGMKFSSGISICITGANADNDNTSAVTGLNVNYSYN